MGPNRPDGRASGVPRRPTAPRGSRAASPPGARSPRSASVAPRRGHPCRVRARPVAGRPDPGSAGAQGSLAGRHWPARTRWPYLPRRRLGGHRAAASSTASTRPLAPTDPGPCDGRPRVRQKEVTLGGASRGPGSRLEAAPEPSMAVPDRRPTASPRWQDREWAHLAARPGARLASPLGSTSASDGAQGAGQLGDGAAGPHALGLEPVVGAPVGALTLDDVPPAVVGQLGAGVCGIRS